MPLFKYGTLANTEFGKYGANTEFGKYGTCNVNANLYIVFRGTNVRPEIFKMISDLITVSNVSNFKITAAFTWLNPIKNYIDIKSRFFILAWYLILMLLRVDRKNVRTFYWPYVSYSFAKSSGTSTLDTNNCTWWFYFFISFSTQTKRCTLLLSFVAAVLKFFYKLKVNYQRKILKRGLNPSSPMESTLVNTINKFLTWVGFRVRLVT